MDEISMFERIVVTGATGGSDPNLAGKLLGKHGTFFNRPQMPD